MTVPIYDLLTQYTGTGSRTFFEYGFEVFADTGVFVLVDGVPVSVVMQATGVIIDPAPGLNSTILIYRETDVTQERDFQPFESFKADKTESAVDKLIYLKQEADLWRALMNLHALPYVDRVEVVNDKGTDAVIFLWDTDEAGMFAGRLGVLPNVGAVVDKPENFAYFECGAGGGEPLFVDFEHFLFIDGVSQQNRYFGVDFDTATDQEFGSFPTPYPSSTSITSDQRLVICPDGIQTAGLYVWRGNVFSKVFSGNTGGLNTSRYTVRLAEGYFLGAGVEAFNHGFRQTRYTDSEPYAFPDSTGYTAVDDNWVAILDFRYSNPGVPGLGDAIAVVGQDGERITTYERVESAYVLRDQITAQAVSTSSSWGWNRDTGLIAAQLFNTTSFNLYQVDMSDLSLSAIGNCSATVDPIMAIGFAANDIIVTLEDTGGAQDAIRTYSRVGTVLTLEDEYLMPGAGVGANSQIQISPYTNRVWCIANSAAAKVTAIEVDDFGQITVKYATAKSVSNAGGQGNPMYFVDGALQITTNGFTGIKQKLYECWEMNEGSSVTRQGALGNLDLAVSGTAGARAGKIGNAVEFTDGSSALTATTPLELYGTGSFSVCLDVYLDSKTGNDQNFIGVHNPALTLPLGTQANWGLRYNTTSGRFEAYAGFGLTVYSVVAEDAGDPATGQWHHVYLEYDAATLKLKIRVELGTTYETVLGGAINHDGTHVVLGRLSSAASARKAQDGATDNVFIFWDVLTSDEQTFMYNSGNSRAFAEL